MLFTDYIAEHLSADGRGGVIVPNGIVATTQNAYVKLWLAGKLDENVETTLAWKAVEKKELLEQRVCSLQAETSFGESTDSSEHDMARIRDVCSVISGQHIDSADYNNDRRGIGYLTGPSDFGPTSPLITK